jgi:hypothetical protein
MSITNAEKTRSVELLNGDIYEGDVHYCERGVKIMQKNKILWIPDSAIAVITEAV